MQVVLSFPTADKQSALRKIRFCLQFFSLFLVFFCRHGDYLQKHILLKSLFLWCLGEMGCHESRCRSSSDSGKQKGATVDKQGEGETKVFHQDVKEVACVASLEQTPAAGCSSELPPACKPIEDYAQKMSEDIVAQTLQLCWEEMIRYKELPFIDND